MKTFAAALLFSLPAVVATAQARDVLIYDTPPSVEELRQDMAPIRTRSIEISGAVTTGAAQAAAPKTTPQPVSQVTQQATPQPAPQKAQQASYSAPKTVGFHIQFGFNSAEIQPESRAFLDQVGKVMQAEPRLLVTVEGHTDAKGGDAYNTALSLRRAASVKAYLVQTWKVASDRLAVEGKGKSEPLVANPYAPENRRVQFRPETAPAS